MILLFFLYFSHKRNHGDDRREFSQLEDREINEDKIISLMHPETRHSGCEVRLMSVLWKNIRTLLVLSRPNLFGCPGDPAKRKPDRPCIDRLKSSEEFRTKSGISNCDLENKDEGFRHVE